MTVNEPTQNKGQVYLIILVVTLFTTEMYFRSFAESEIEETLVKVGIVIIPVILLLFRLNWAKWLVSVILILNGVISFMGGLEFEFTFFLIAAFNFFFAIIIHFSPSIKHYLKPEILGEVTKKKESVEYENTEYPYLVTRIKASFIDGLVLFGLYALSMIIVQDPEMRPNVFVGLIVVAILYEPIMLTSFSATVGHNAMRIKVVKYGTHGEKISFVEGVIRIIVKFLLGWMSFLTINFNPGHRAIHDFASSSIVLDRKKSS